jgi:hypothetical protein
MVPRFFDCEAIDREGGSHGNFPGATSHHSRCRLRPSWVNPFLGPKWVEGINR